MLKIQWLIFLRTFFLTDSRPDKFYQLIFTKLSVENLVDDDRQSGRKKTSGLPKSPEITLHNTKMPVAQ